RAAGGAAAQSRGLAFQYLARRTERMLHRLDRARRGVRLPAAGAPVHLAGRQAGELLPRAVDVHDLPTPVEDKDRVGAALEKSGPAEIAVAARRWFMARRRLWHGELVRGGSDELGQNNQGHGDH